MNFMSGRPAGFYEEPTTGGMSLSSSSSSSSSSLQHKGLPLYTYHHHHHPEQPAAQLPDSSPTNNDEAVDDNSDDHMMFIRRGGEGSSTGTAAHNHHVVIEREHMFDKVVTPSDVGKLNRLVIPKQHAEKYFPLDSSTNEKGLLLNFEDRNGKPWRFRYSYWNSSQSYVMTKGWSRFVKEKKLDAGDIVSFQRGIGESGKDRLFIDWRRRPDAPDLPPTLSIPHQFSFQRSSIHPWNPLFLQPPQSRSDYSHYLLQNHQSSYHHHQNIHSSSSSSSAGYGAGPYAYNNSGVVNGNPCPPGSIVYLQRSGAPGGGRGVYGPQQVGIMQAPQRRSSGVHHDQQQQQMVYESVPVVQGKAAAKRLRLFGVNMDCPISESDHHHLHHHNHEYNCDILHSSSSTTTIPPHSSSTIPLIHHMNNNGLIMPPSPPNYFHSSPPPSSSIPYLQLGPNSYYNDHSDDDKGKGGGSMSLDLDI
ncbi:hypothetical protein BUALT_Bualt10G0001400 [Buddleja alternifolia]|uniref:TF-B3 domain-containing protein n=1 Tax=Buddleja alternifolia TaxID=168488 RepID=A0AAV6WU28_9LAMI|nr:hypothetical protein BUALT_Bualt10G0001400 [Buddleja alternifolia]